MSKNPLDFTSAAGKAVLAAAPTLVVTAEPLDTWGNILAADCEREQDTEETEAAAMPTECPYHGAFAAGVDYCEQCEGRRF